MWSIFWRYAEAGRERRRYLNAALWHLAVGRIKHLLMPSHVLLAPALALNQAALRVRPMASGFDPQKAALAIAAVSAHVPWRSDCLVQALAANTWLECNGYAPRLHVGLSKDGNGVLKAHAWLELDGEVIVGSESGRYQDFVPFRSSPTSEVA